MGILNKEDVCLELNLQESSFSLRELTNPNIRVNGSIQLLVKWNIA